MLAWCAANRPDGEPPAALLWGDVRLGNVVFDPATCRPRAVLDWDMASVGPAEMDLAWFLGLEALQVELTGMAVAGFGNRDEAIAVRRGTGSAGRCATSTGTRCSRSSGPRRWRPASRCSSSGPGSASMFRVGEDPTLAAAAARIDRL